MSTETTPLAPAVVDPKPSKAPVLIGHRGLELNNLEELWRFSGYVSISGFAPKGLEKQESVFIAVQMGLELGLSPMAALQNIAVINGRPGIYGDAALACVRASGLLEKYEEWYEVDSKPLVTGSGHSRNPTAKEVEQDSCTAYVLTQRKGAEQKVEGFSTGDAKLANLWKKAGPWSQYPARMLKFRARGFNLRDNFGDVLKGFRTSEELADDPEQRTGFETAKPIFSVAAQPPVAASVAVAPTPEPVAPVETAKPEPVQPTASEAAAQKHAPEKQAKLDQLKARLEDEKLPQSDFEAYLVRRGMLEAGKTVDFVSLPRLTMLIDKVGDIAAELKGQGQLGV